MLAVEGYVDPQKLPLIAKNEYEQIKDNINKMSPHIELPESDDAWRPLYSGIPEVICNNRRNPSSL